MSTSSSQPAETNKNASNDYLSLSQPSSCTDVSQLNYQNPNQVQIKLDDLSAALLPSLSTRIQETLTTQLTSQFQYINQSIKTNLEKINFQLSNIGKRHDRLENDISQVTTAISEMKREYSTTQSKVDQLEKTVEVNQQIIADLRAEIKAIADSRNKIEDELKHLRESTDKDNGVVNLLPIEEKVDSLMREKEKDMAKKVAELVSTERLEHDQNSTKLMTACKMELMEQYSRRDCLLFYGLNEDPHEDTTQKVLETVLAMGIEIEPQEISISHRLQTMNRKPREPRPIIAKF